MALKSKWCRSKHNPPVERKKLSHLSHNQLQQIRYLRHVHWKSQEAPQTNGNMSHSTDGLHKFPTQPFAEGPTCCDPQMQGLLCSFCKKIKWCYFCRQAHTIKLTLSTHKKLSSSSFIQICFLAHILTKCSRVATWARREKYLATNNPNLFV